MNDRVSWGADSPQGSGPWYALFEAVAAGAAGMVAAFALTLAVGAGARDLFTELPFLLSLLGLFLVSSIGLVAGGIGFLRLRGLAARTYVGYGIPGFRDLLWAGAGYVGAFALIILAGLALSFFQAEPETANQAAQLGIENPEFLLWLVPLSLFVIAPAEEFLFRGVVQGRLREAFSARVAIPIAAAIFALVHYVSLTGAAGDRLVAVAVLFLPSLVFGVTYERTKNLVVPILVHGFYNATLVLLLYVTIRVLGETPPV